MLRIKLQSLRVALSCTTLRELGHKVESEVGVCKNGENAWVGVSCRLQRNLDPQNLPFDLGYLGDLTSLK